MKRSFVTAVARWNLCLFFVAAGANHFVMPGVYLTIMPPWLPWPLALVYISGVAEMAGGIGAMIPRLRVLAGWGLIALLVAVFPANIQMLLHPISFAGKPVSEWVLWARLPLQFAFMAWVYWTCIRTPAAKKEL